MAEVRQRAEKICRANVPVLISGDGGTGKETLARWIHLNSAAKNGIFVKVNCAAIPVSLLESELFGYEKGAFTGANTSKPGRIEESHNGTLFLDEIADLDMGVQSKLLHFLQDGSFSRIGDSAVRNVNARVICSTGKDLNGEVDSGRFRSDLLYRINVVALHLPNLKQRREDIPRLADHLRKQYEVQFSMESKPFSDEICHYLQNMSWPGNLRELANSIARYVLIGAEGIMAESAFHRRPAAVAKASLAEREAVPLKRIAKEAVREIERNVILEALRAHHWNRRKAAQSLKISYRALIYKIRDAGLTLRNGESTNSLNRKVHNTSTRSFPGD